MVTKGESLFKNVTLRRALGWALIGLIVIGVLGPCFSTGPPAIDPRVINHQVELVNRTMEALHEEVAAARSPSGWPLALFLLSILTLLAAGIWLLWRAEQSAIGHDPVIRAMIRAGLGQQVVRAYLEEVGRHAELPSSSVDLPALPPASGSGSALTKPPTNAA